MMKPVSEVQGAAFVRAMHAIQTGRVAVAVINGVPQQVTRLFLGVESPQGPILEFDEIRTFDTIEEAKTFLKGEAVEQIAASFNDTEDNELCTCGHRRVQHIEFFYNCLENTPLAIDEPCPCKQFVPAGSGENAGDVCACGFQRSSHTPTGGGCENFHLFSRGDSKAA